MARPRIKLFVVLLLVLALGLVWLLRDRQVHTTRLRMSGYQPAPKTGFRAWMGRWTRKLDGTKLNSQCFKLGDHDLMWCYSSPTSGWFQFGAFIQNSNACYWAVAVPKARDLAGALAEVPFAQFATPTSTAVDWKSVVGAENFDMRPAVTGGGAIRLPVGQPLLLRHIAETNVTYVVECHDVSTAYNGDTKVRFRHRTLVSAPSR